ncbi:hypothetical protein JG688_00002027 [Phytophthora aleatoria]|uniref:PX domain-containing protein n=1 Tax=Phytophthora aleatoria TaxID=2496075 RepID=A0A8J5JB93_9STRA|nr:hypothetical protein JG688_00002027 [Phytophthora aleatoria]
MIDEDSISVVITASKEIEGGDTLDSDEGSAKLHNKRHKYTMYTVFVRNVTTGGKCVVRRRYSDFFKLRKELMELVSWGHCSFCEQYVQQIADYPFPRRRLLRSSRAAVVKERMDSLGLFLRHMLLCIMARSFENCSQACENIESCILKSFLQMDQTETLFPTMASKQRPIEILQAMEEKRQQQIKAAGLRTKSLAYTTLSDQSDQSRLSRNQRQVGTDTCHLCLQKWTHCYCNSDQDSVYPVIVAAVSTGNESPVHERPSVSMGDSETSRCSRNAVPWLDWAGWQEVHVGLFSSDPFAQQRVVSRVASWRSRMQLPVAINATAQLVELQLHQSMAQNHHHAVGVSSRSHMELSLLYASVIVRCVNGLVDGSQKGAYAMAVSTLAQRIGIPLWIVDLRHESSHNQLPSLPVLRFAARHLLAWLRSNYWGAQEDLVRGQVHHVAQWLFEQLPHLNKQPSNEEMEVDAAQGIPTPTLDADTLRNIVIPLLVVGEQYSERVAPTGLLFLEATVLPEDQDAAEIFQKETFITLLLQLQPLWRGFSASLLSRLCRKVFDAICPAKSRRQSEDEKDDSAQGAQNMNAFQRNEMDMTLQWIKFMVSSEYRERIKLQIGPIEDLCQCGAEMLALAEKLKSDDAAGDHAELLERLLTALRSSKGVRNHSTLATEAAIATSLAADSNQRQVCEYSLDDDMLMPDSTVFVAPDEEEEDTADPDDAEKAIDALMEELDAAYDSALQHNLDLQATIARDGLRQGSSTTVLPKQELQRIQEEIEIW